MRFFLFRKIVLAEIRHLPLVLGSDLSLYILTLTRYPL